MMRILIVYNIADEIRKGDESDLVCEQEIKVIVPLIKKLLEKKGYAVKTTEASFSLWETLRSSRGSFDIVFNMAEAFGGTNTHEPLVPMMLEALDIPFTGASAHNMCLTLDKEKTKLVAMAYGVPTPRYKVLHTVSESMLEIGINFPLIVKPIREEASIGIRSDNVVVDEVQLQRKTKELLRLYKQPVLAETFVPGREISVGVIGNRNNLHVFPPLEFLFEGASTPYERIRSYEYKWGGKTEHMVKAEVSPCIERMLKEYAQSMFLATECRDYARMDFRLDADGTAYLLEVNYNPGIGPNSHGLNNTLTKMASFENWKFEDLIERILLTAVNREGLM